jgi:hypothetical protein
MSTVVKPDSETTTANEPAAETSSN